MSSHLTQIELIKLLIEDRNLHFSHPHEVSKKFFYSLGGVIAPLLIGILIKSDSLSNIQNFIDNNSILWMFGSLILCGYGIIAWGLAEHSRIHANQRKRLESAIEYLILTKEKDYDFENFWSQFGSVHLNYSGKRTSMNPTRLLVAEPDTRHWLRYHDRKIQLGIIIIVGCIVGILLTILN